MQVMELSVVRMGLRDRASKTRQRAVPWEILEALLGTHYYWCCSNVPCLGGLERRVEAVLESGVFGGDELDIGHYRS